MAYYRQPSVGKQSGPRNLYATLPHCTPVYVLWYNPSNARYRCQCVAAASGIERMQMLSKREMSSTADLS